MSILDNRLTRRSMLLRSSLATGLMAAGIEPLLAAADSRWFKIGGCEWMLGKCEPASLETAQRIGLDGIQLGMGLHGDTYCRTQHWTSGER